MALTDNLEAFWKLEDLTDSVNSHTLTNNNAATFAAGKIGNAAHLSAASSQSLSIANASLGALNPSGTAFSVSLWFYLDSLSYSVLMGTMATYNSDGWQLVAEDFFGSVILSFTNVNNGFSYLSTSTGAWHHIAVSIDAAGNCTYCYDGTYASGSSSPAPVAGAADLRIGANASGSYVDGKVDAVGFWSRVLSEAEMLELWNGGAGLELPPVPVSRRALVAVDGVVAELPIGESLIGGLPTGGSDGQVLTKTSGSDFAVAWETPSGGGSGGGALGTRSTLTVASDAVTVTGHHHAIEAEGGPDLDDLSTISGGSDGDLLLLTAVSGNTITVKHGVDNIRLTSGSDLILLDESHTLLLIKTGGNWCQIAASYNTSV